MDNEIYTKCKKPHLFFDRPNHPSEALKSVAPSSFAYFIAFSFMKVPSIGILLPL